MVTYVSFRHKWAVIGGLLLLLTFSLWADPPPLRETIPQQAYGRVLSILERNPAAAEENDFLLVNNLMAFCTDEASAPPAAKLLLYSLAEDSRNASEVRITSVRELACFHDDDAHAKLKSYLTDAVIAVPAAAVLVEWGDWDDGAPTLITHEAYDPLVRTDRGRAEPILRDHVMTASPLGRLYAAYALFQYYGDPTLLAPTARDLIEAYGDVAQPGEDTLTISKILDAAYSALQEEISSDDLHLFVAGMRDRFFLVRGTSFRGLISLARAGNQAALQEIQRLKEQSPYLDVRERAEMGLKSLNMQQQH